ncbi:MAG: lysine-sensitive aspartokinase 3 [Ignavibacteria bacterium]|jgi:aspartate kinase
MIVMKFGGTSVQDSEAYNRVINIVKSRIEKKPVVVLSATAKTTDTLLLCCKTASEGNYEKASEIIKQIKDRHLKIAAELVVNESKLGELKTKTKDLLDGLRDIIKGIYLLSELSERSIAKVLSHGELLSTLILTYALNQKDIKAEYLDARNIMFTSKDFSNAEPLFDVISQKAPEQLTPIIKAGKVAITQGFIANTLDGITTTFSRGGSDYSASIIGMAMKAEEVEIWTDVNGILTADPKIVSDTKIINEITFKEAAELAFFGAKVLHPSTIIPAIEKNIPVRVLNSHHPEGKGTLIKNVIEESDYLVKSITSKKEITVLNIYSPKMLLAHGFLKKIFEVFDKYKTSVDMITTSEVNVSLTLDNDENLQEIIKELSLFSEVNVEKDKSLVCIVGNNLKYIPGIAKKIFQVLGNYNITMISQGASIVNISFVVDKDCLNNVIQTLHKEFFG